KVIQRMYSPFCLRPSRSTRYPITALFRSVDAGGGDGVVDLHFGVHSVRYVAADLAEAAGAVGAAGDWGDGGQERAGGDRDGAGRWGEHTSELRSSEKLVCRILLEI